jgi:hypothetical protein
MRRFFVLIILFVAPQMVFSERPTGEDCYQFCRQYGSLNEFVACMEGCLYGSGL